MTAPDRVAADALTWVVPADGAGERIDRLLHDRLGGSRAQAQARLGRGEVRVDGQVVGKSHRVAAGARIELAAPPAPAPRAVPPPVPLRYDDDDVAVVAKPAGLVVHPGAGVRSGTLVDALRAAGVRLAPAHDPARPGIVHRLDRGTSGLLVVAKTAAALQALRRQFDAHTISRRYRALVEGVPDPPAAVVDAPIARHPRDRTRFRTAPDGRAARSRYRVLAAHGVASDLEVTLETGRTHQVRVHLSALGHPVCGDRVYGAAGELAARLGLDRPALHAAHLGFDHPRTGVRVVVDEPLPADLSEALGRLEAGPG